MPRRREKPIPRENPSGERVWVARWTDRQGRRRYGMKPDIPGTHKLKRDAQAAIDLCHERDEQGAERPGTFGGYAATWQQVHPRARVTNATNKSRLNAVLDVEIEGAALRDWPYDQLRRRHANLLVDHMLRVQGRAYTGVTNILGTLSAMTEDAIDDEVTIANPFKGVKVRANDPRIQKQRRKVRVFSWEDMHGFARACADAKSLGREINQWRRIFAEPMVRTLSDCGLRAGELLILCQSDLDVKAGSLDVRWTTNLGDVHQGTKTDHGELDAGRVVPIPPGLLEMLKAMPKRIDGVVERGDAEERLLFPSPRGKLWGYADWWKYVWEAGREESGMDIRPHECRHSYVSLLRAAGVDVADLADATGHTVETATSKYTHGLGRSFEAIRKAVGE